jgi:hypothetical protein
MALLDSYLVKNGAAVLPENADWNLTITFPRPDPTRGDNDITRYPQSGSVTVPGSQFWEVDFGTDIRGGEAVFTCAFGSESPTHKVHIRGRNPIPDSIPETYIDNNCGVHWYAKRIARYESHVWVPEGNPEYNSASGGADYNQCYPQDFGTPPLPPSQNPLTRQYGGPVHDDAYGWGFFQLTNPRADPQQVWDWKANTAQAMVILGTKRQNAVDWVASQRAQMHTYRSGQSPPQPDLPVPAQPYGNETFGDNQSHPPDDACTIQAYKSATLWVLYWDNNALPVPIWKWRTDGNAAYVVSVCS